MIETTISIAIVALILGYFIAKLLEKKKASSTLKNVREQASTILKEAKIEADGIKKDKILQAKEKFIELKSEHEKVIISRDKKINEAEKRIRESEAKPRSRKSGQETGFSREKSSRARKESVSQLRKLTLEPIGICQLERDCQFLRREREQESGEKHSTPRRGNMTFWN